MTEQDGKVVIARLAAAYSALESYQDTGSVITLPDGESTPHEMYFETRFVRPGRFRFDLLSPHPFAALRESNTYHIVACDGHHAFEYQRDFRGQARVNEAASLALAVAGATGISHGAAHTIARLALPGISGLSLSDLAPVRWVSIDDVDGFPCHHLVATRGNEEFELHVDAEMYLLRRLRTRAPGFSVEEVRRDIRPNSPPDARDFAPPLEEKIHDEASPGRPPSEPRFDPATSESWRDMTPEDLEYLRQLAEKGPIPIPTREELKAELDADLARWRERMRRAGYEPGGENNQK